MTGAVHYEIEHLSHYSYTAPVQQCVMLLCLEPREDRGQQLLDFEIETQPPANLNRETDCFGNTRHLLDLHQTHQILEITTRSTVEVASAPPLPARLHAGAWEDIRSRRESCANWDFTHPSALVRPSPALTEFVARHRIEPRDDPLESLMQLSHTLHDCLQYIPGSTTAESSVEHILETGRGVCQDYAHLMIAIARSWDIPTRYVSGYLNPTDQSGDQAPSNATHAWVECRLPALGWVGFDPTNQSFAGEGGKVHIAVGRDYHDVSPTRGVLQGGGETRLEVDVRTRSFPIEPP
ncbi:MAG: transglutaminase family protein [Gemmatimonadetes bacterium]|nr:transglutaminase family protein [Gemmatimonadota bacterium]